MSNITIKIDPPNGRPYRAVRFLDGGREIYRDSIDPDSGRGRAQAIEGLAAALGQPVETLAHLGQEIREAADAASNAPVRAELVSLASVEPEAVNWLWPQRIAIGKLTVVAGDPGLGKSFLSLDLAARVSRGCRWPDGSGEAPLGSVVLLSAEDDLADTIRPRLDAAGADVARIHALAAVHGRDQHGEYRRGFDLSRDVARLEEVIAELGDCRLLVVDPISAYLGATKGNDNVEVRGVLAPLSELAGRLGVAVVAVSHLRKGEGPAMYRTMGSMAFVAAARAAFAVCRDQDDQAGRRRLMLPVKNNLGNDETGLAYRLAAAEPGDTPHVLWEPAPVSTKADDALARPQGRRGPKPDAQAKAELFLRKQLADAPQPAAELTEQAWLVHGITERALRRARKALGVVAYRETVPGPWWWKLPEDSQGGQVPGGQDPDTEHLGHLGHLAKNKGETAVSEADEPKAAKFPEDGHLGPDDDENAPWPEPDGLDDDELGGDGSDPFEEAAPWT